ncbi:MAG: hypothetical protein ACM3O5_10335 [Betaproteobacteria bacterium]|jgi:hypothetical protein
MSWLIAVFLALPLAAMAQSPAPAKNPAPAPMSKEAQHRSEDIARHRQMARAHEEAARCLEGGAPEKQCQERLREMCKGIAVGQYCGMRHGH